MARPRTKSKPVRLAAPEATLARTLAPEDIRPGDHVAVLDEAFEYPSWYWCEESLAAPRDEAVRVRFTPRDDAVPMKIRAVCLPFVLVSLPCGRERTLDVRRVRLARLDQKFARAARSSFRRALKTQRRTSANPPGANTSD